MSTPLNETQIRKSLEELKGWSVEDDKLKKEFKFKNFRQTIAFIVRVAFEAEERDHHPELFNVYNKVTLSLATHDAGGRITAKDVELARAIDTL